MKKVKSISFTVLAVLLYILNITTVFAAPQALETGNGVLTPKYLGGLYFQTNLTKEGKPLYCINKDNASVVNQSIYLDGEEDEAIGYLLAMGYPYHTFTGDNIKDQYITQVALWWYLDEVRGTNTVNQEVKIGQDAYNIRPYIETLLKDVRDYKAKGNASLKLETTSKKLKLVNNNYETEVIKISKNKVDEAILTTSEGTIEEVTKENNKVTSFKVTVPKEKVTGNFKLTVKIEGKSPIYKAYRYTTKKSGFQNLVLVETEEKNLNKTLDFETLPSQVTIKKVSSETGKTVAGAKLRITNSTGKVIAEWTTTDGEYIINNLEAGKYTIEEIEAPAGYIKNESKKEFEVFNDGKKVYVEFQNAPIVIVPNTSSSSLIITLLGVLFLLSGLRLYKKYAKAR